MTPEEKQTVKAHLDAVAAILYQNTDVEKLQSLEDIEQVVRQHMLENVSPQIGLFFIQSKTEITAGKSRRLRSCIGEIEITQKQAQRLQVDPHSQISGHLEKCCLLLSANESYERASQDIQILTGMSISHSTQQRLVDRHSFSEAAVNEYCAGDEY